MAKMHHVCRKLRLNAGESVVESGCGWGTLALHMARHTLIECGQHIEIHLGLEMGRPSLLRARVEGTADQVERVVVGGSAVIVAEGRYRLR